MSEKWETPDELKRFVASFRSRRERDRYRCAQQSAQLSNVPNDIDIVAIVDTLEMGGKVVYRKHEAEEKKFQKTKNKQHQNNNYQIYTSRFFVLYICS